MMILCDFNVIYAILTLNQLNCSKTLIHSGRKCDSFSKRVNESFTHSTRSKQSFTQLIYSIRLKKILTLHDTQKLQIHFIYFKSNSDPMMYI